MYICCIIKYDLFVETFHVSYLPRDIISNYKDKLRALRQEYGKHKFYVGLTDIEEENVWKWTSSGRILSLANNPWDDGTRKIQIFFHPAIL